MTKTHRMSRTPEHNTWTRIRYRCYGVNSPDYPNYGGRGIVMAPEWDDFERFYADMGPRPSPRHSIDRIDNNGPYAPGNCRWALPQGQANNRRSGHLLTHDGATRTLAEWERITGIKQSTLRRRISVYGWTAADALSIRPLKRDPA